jgi:hypothetical protein
MTPRKQGLIVTLSSPGAIGYLFNIPYGVGKAAVSPINSISIYSIYSAIKWRLTSPLTWQTLE